MVPELDHLYQGFSYLSRVIEYQNSEETTPKISIFKALENCLLVIPIYLFISVVLIYVILTQRDLSIRCCIHYFSSIHANSFRQLKQNIAVLSYNFPGPLHLFVFRCLHFCFVSIEHTWPSSIEPLSR